MIHSLRAGRACAFALFTTLAFQACQSPTAQQDAHTTHTDSSAAAAKAVAEAVPADWRIVAGERIGQTYLGEAQEAVVKRMGQPAWGDAAMGHVWSSWFPKSAAEGSDTTSHRVDVYAQRDTGAVGTLLVQQIRVTSPRFRTDAGIATRQSWDSIRTQYPQAVAVASYPLKNSQDSVQVYDDTQAGIAFEVGPDQRCVAILVHSTQAPATNTYLALHPGTHRLK